MAEVVRYVNTASTAGGDGTTNATAGANRAYASLSEWESNEQTDLVTDTDNHVVICEGTTADSTAVTIDGWTTSATYDIEIKTDDVANGRHEGVWSTSYYRLTSSSYFGTLRLDDAFIYINGLQIESTGDGSGGADHAAITTRFSPGSNTYRMSHCVLTGYHGLYADNMSNDTRVFKIWNNIVYDCSNYGLLINNLANDELYIHNNTVVDCTSRGISLALFGASDTLSLRNNAVFNCADDYSIGSTATTSTITHNAYSEGSDPGTSGIDISGDAGTDLFNDYNNDDFHLAGTGSSLYQVGVDLDSDSNLAVTDDIDGDTRNATTPCVGADEYIDVGGGLSIPVAMHHYTKNIG